MSFFSRLASVRAIAYLRQKLAKFKVRVIGKRSLKLMRHSKSSLNIQSFKLKR